MPKWLQIIIDLIFGSRPDSQAVERQEAERAQQIDKADSKLTDDELAARLRPPTPDR